MITIGVLSDTHLREPNDFFRHLVRRCFAGASIILHAGDLTGLGVLDVFGSQEVHAVHGNMCPAQTRTALPRKKIVRVADFSIGLIHRTGVRYDFEADLLDEFDLPDCIVYGHTHRPACHRMGGVLYVNPGGFLPTSRHGAPGTYALITAGETLHGEIREVPWPE